MRKYRLPLCIFMILCLCASGAFAQAKKQRAKDLRTVYFNTWPSGAKVFLGDNEMGVTGKALEIDLNEFPGGGDAVFTFKLDGYREKTVEVSVGYFRKAAKYPESGSLRLAAMSPLSDLKYMIRDNMIIVIGAVIVLLAVAGYLVMLRQKRPGEGAEYVATAPREAAPPPPPAEKAEDRTPSGQGFVPGRQAPPPFPSFKDSVPPRTEPAAPPPPPAPAKFDQVKSGTVYGGYRVIETISSQGPLSVYRGLPKMSNDERQSVVIKVMNLEGGEEDAFIQRFRREISITLELTHPNLIRVLGWGEAKGELYFITEMVAGHTLREKMAPGGVSFKEFNHLFSQLCDGLACAHDGGIVHRDIKPECILVTPDGRVVITDFTIAKGFAHFEVTMGAAAFGTPGYVAPEQLQGGTLDPRSDQFSLGVICYELLAGRRPFANESLMAAIMQQLNEEAPALRSFRPDIPEKMEAMVLRMIAKKPVERFYDLREVQKYFMKEVMSPEGNG